MNMLHLRSTGWACRLPAGLAATASGAGRHHLQRQQQQQQQPQRQWPQQPDTGPHSRIIPLAPAAAAAAAGGGSEEPTSGGSRGPLQWLRSTFGGNKLDKQKLVEAGLGAFLSYGIVSNVNAAVLVTLAWLTVVQQTGVTPLDGMWPRFLAIYAGLYLAVGSVLRPARLALALMLAPLFNRALDAIQARLRVPKAAAFGVMLGAVAVTSFTAMAAMLVLCGGFPNGLPQLPWKR